MPGTEGGVALGSHTAAPKNAEFAAVWPMHIQVGESAADMLRNASPGGRSSASGMTALRQDSWGGIGGGGAEDEGVRPALRRT